MSFGARMARAWAERRSAPWTPPGPARAALAPCAAAAALTMTLALAGGWAAERWASAREAGFGRAATVVLAEGSAAAIAAAREVLETTPGIAAVAPAAPPEEAEQGVAVLAVTLASPEGPDAAALNLRLGATVPGAVYDDHAEWRRPLLASARAGRRLGWGAAAAAAVSGLAVAARLGWAAGAEAGPAAALLVRLGATRAEAIRRAAAPAAWRAALGGALGAGLVGTGLAAARSAGFAPGAGTGLALTPEEFAWAGLAVAPAALAGSAWLGARGAAARALGPAGVTDWRDG